MARKTSHNYTLALGHKTTYRIPIIGIEVQGATLFVLSILVWFFMIALFTLVISMFLDLIPSVLLSSLFSSIILMVFLSYKKTIAGEEGNNAMTVFYYKNLRSYREIVTNLGIRKLLPGRKKGGVVCIRI